MSEQNIEGWDVVRKRFVVFPWVKIVNVRSNSKNYNRVDDLEWRRRQRHTNLQWDEDKQIRQSLGVFWMGKKVHKKEPRRIG